MDIFSSIPIGAEFAEQAGIANALESVYATGYWLHEQGRYKDAADVFRVLLQAAPTEERSWLALASCHEQAGHWNVALELYGTGTVAAQPAPRCMLARARLLKSVGKEPEASEAFDEAEMLADQIEDSQLKQAIQLERKI